MVRHIKFVFQLYRFSVFHHLLIDIDHFEICYFFTCTSLKKNCKTLQNKKHTEHTLNFALIVVFVVKLGFFLSPSLFR